MKFVLKEIWDLGNLLPKLSRNPKIKSQDQTSRRKPPDGRTRRGHAPKRAANRRHVAAKTRPKPRFRGKVDKPGYAFSLRSFSGTLLPSAPINTPAVQPRRASSEIQGQKIRFFRLSSSLGFLFSFVIFIFSFM